MADFESLLDRLLDAEVEFVLVGGFAAITHGISLLTQDVDVCCRFTALNLYRLQRALSDLQPVHRMTPNRIPLDINEKNADSFKNLYLDTDYGQLDCLSEIVGVGDYENVLSESLEFPIKDHTCRILNLDALIRSKQSLNRPRDKEAVIQLEAIRERLNQTGELDKQNL